MLILARFVGIIMVGMGITFLLSPNALKQVINFWGQGKRVYIAGILRLLIGVLLLLIASQCRFVGTVVTLGILIFIGGITIFVLGLERIKSILNWWNKRSLLVLRLMALIALAIGALLLYSI
ncbi:MAG: hypothetical protein AMJ78_09485 [Omnitrophica WOR_2 bacterium SM23_29]|nr:MAG: hypothetical protein AMJ78_09485 [Omnitrophica WOR_2 bacterium SM23_29]